MSNVIFCLSYDSKVTLKSCFCEIHVFPIDNLAECVNIDNQAN